MAAAEIPLLILLGVLFVAAMFIAAAETALIRLTPVRARTLAEQGSRPGRVLTELTTDLPKVLNAVLLTALLVQVGAATVTGILADRLFGSVGVTLASAVLTVLLFVYTEAIPKTFAVRHAERVALAVAWPIRVLELVLRPVVSVLVWFADLQMPGKGITTSPTVTEGELRRLAGDAAREGEIDQHDLELIERAFRFGDRRADDIMVPRTDVVMVEADTTADAAAEVALAAGHRRLPVYDDRPDNVVGTVRLRDVAAAGAATPVREVMGEALVVPETKRVTELLAEMQAAGTHLALVVDEYGGLAGLVTIEDIAEELLGSITDDPGRPPIEPLEPGRWSVDATIPVEDLGDLLELEVTEGDWNTAAGLVLARLGRIPEVGDVVEVEGARIEVVGMHRRRITRLEVVADQPTDSS